MTITIGIGHLGNHDLRVTLRITTDPERHRVEDVAQHARLCQKPNLSRIGQVMGGQNVTHPRRTASLSNRASVVAIPKRCDTGAIPSENPWCLDRRFGIQKHIVDTIAKRVFHGTLAPMPRVAGDMVDGFHSAATGTLPRSLIASATSNPLASPSSWKPWRIHAPQNHV